MLNHKNELVLKNISKSDDGIYFCAAHNPQGGVTGQARYAFSRIHSKPINIRLIRTGSHSYEKTMSCMVLYTVFYKYKNVQS